MKFDGSRLPAEYTDFMLLLSRLPFDCIKIKIRSYAEHDLILREVKRGESSMFCDDSPLCVLGQYFKATEQDFAEDGLWDCCAYFAGITRDFFVRSSKLMWLETLSEEYGYAVTAIDDDAIYFEVMDRVILNGYSIRGAQELCNDFGIDYSMLCSQALSERKSTYDLLRLLVSEKDMDRMYYHKDNTENNVLVDEACRVSAQEKSIAEEACVFDENVSGKSR